MTGRRARTAVAMGCLAAASLVGACERAPTGDDTAAPSPGTAKPTTAGESDEAFVRRAHRQALDRFVAAAQPALVIAYPATAHALDLAPPTAPPLSRASRNALRTAVDAALKEAEGIDRAALSAEDGMLRDAVATALHRLRRELGPRPALRRDPGALVSQLSPTLVQLRAACTKTPRQAICTDGLQRLGTELSRSVGQLGAASDASLRAAMVDLAQLRRSLEPLGSVDSAATAAVAAGLDAWRVRLEAIAAILPEAKAVDWQAPVGGATTPAAVVRLPDRLGATELSRRLADEESVAMAPAALAEAITLTLARLSAMQAKLPSAAAGSASPGSVPRCRAAWESLAPWATANPALAGAGIDCDAWPGSHDRTRRTDGAWMLAVFDAAVVEPARRTRRLAVPPALALAQGEMASAGARLALSVTGLIGAGAPGGASAALDRARAQLCVALAATLEHAELGEAERRSVALREACPQTPVAALVAAALARPRRALAPAGMVWMNRGPAEAAALSRFWWAPLGLVLPLAAPPDPTPDPRGRREANIEVIEPDPTPAEPDPNAEATPP